MKAFSEPLSFANVLLFTMALHMAFFWRRRCSSPKASSLHFISFALFSSFVLRRSAA
jgi:hypothetical protein